MSERSGYSTGIRPNPMYDAGSESLPAWPTSKSPKTTVFGETGSTPPDSPRGSSRSGYTPSAYRPPQFEHPSYTVETPGHRHAPLNSPYRPPSYFVNTPGRSERPASPMSSAPSSPSRYGNGNGLDVQSMRSGRTGMSNGSNGRKTLKSVEEEMDDDEEAALTKDDHPKKKTKWRKICCALLVLVAILAIVAGCVACWYIFQPSPPDYNFDGATMWNLQAVNKLEDGTGLPTDMITMNVSVQLTMRNSNSHFTAFCDGGILQVGYATFDPLMQAGLPRFEIASNKKTPFSSSTSVKDFPLYGAGPGLRQDIASKVLPVMVKVAVHSHVEMVWKIVQTYYTHIVDCNINFNPITLLPINNTCSVKRTQ